MGLSLATVLSFTRRIINGENVAEVKVDPGGNATVTPWHVSASGDDSQPLPQDIAARMKIEGEGRQVVVGYVDTLNAGQALAGEKRLYSRDSSGTPVAVAWLKNTGELLLMNGGGYILLGSSGTINLNGVTISPSGEVEAPGDVVGAGVSLSTHTHNFVGVDTGVPSVTQAPNA